MKNQFLQNMGLDGQTEEFFGAELSESIRIAMSIANELGSDRDVFFLYLAQYLYLIFEVSDNGCFSEATDKGIQSIRNMIETDKQLPTGFPTLIDADKLSKLGCLKEDVLYALSGELLPHVVRNYTESLRSEVERHIEQSGINKNYEAICSMLGDSSSMDALNQKLIKTFIKVLPLDYYRYEIIRDVLYTLHYIREDSEKTVIEDIVQLLSE